MRGKIDKLLNFIYGFNIFIEVQLLRFINIKK